MTTWWDLRTSGDNPMTPDFATMNETDVREIVVRPLLERLGYRHGTEANVRTEVTLRYDRAFLGRKNPAKDPALAGRADYLCDAIPYGRWVVEVKAPSEEITRDTIEQAHTYAAHPEVAAAFFMVTNGREFHLYRTSMLDAPVLAWPFEEIEQRLLALFNLVSPDALAKLAKSVRPDPGKPLGTGLPSVIRLSGGEVRYEEHVGDHPFLQADVINGLRLPITGGSVQRTEDGRIHGHVDVANAMPLMKELTEATGLDGGYDFYSASEYLSTDREAPSIFQNFVASQLLKGTPIAILGMGKMPSPFTMAFSSFTEAIGFADGDRFKGTMRLAYDFSFTGMDLPIRQALQAQFGRIPSTARMEGLGSFEIEFISGV